MTTDDLPKRLRDRAAFLGRQGFFGTIEREAADELERLRLTWTTRVPETPGYYWWRRSDDEADVVMVDAFLRGRIPWTGSCCPVAELGGEWSSGPIPLPGDG